MGISRSLKMRNPNIEIVAVEPSESNILSGGEFGSHQISGIGFEYIPKIVEVSEFDKVMKASSDEAVNMARRMAREEGIMCGISAGAACHVAC